MKGSEEGVPLPGLSISKESFAKKKQTKNYKMYMQSNNNNNNNNNNERIQVHCSAVIARSSGSMNADRDLSGPCSIDLGNPLPLFCMHDSRFLLLL